MFQNATVSEGPAVSGGASETARGGRVARLRSRAALANGVVWAAPGAEAEAGEGEAVVVAGRVVAPAGPVVQVGPGGRHAASTTCHLRVLVSYF